jgi:hypothetical protein
MAHRAQRRVSTPTKPGGCVTMRLPVLFAQGHLEEGRELLGQDLLTRVCEHLKIPRQEWVAATHPFYIDGFAFHRLACELTGRQASLLDHCATDQLVALDRAQCLFRSHPTPGQAHAQVNALLVFYGERPITKKFFEKYLGVDAFKHLASFLRNLRVFQADAMRLYGNFRRAFTRMSRVDDLDAELEPLVRKNIERYCGRSPFDTIKEINADRLAELGYIAAQKIETQNRERLELSDALRALAKDVEAEGHAALHNLAEKKLRRLRSLLRKFESALVLEHSLFATLDHETLLLEAERVAPEKKDLVRIGQTQEEGLRNLGVYLSEPFMDVYVATSMRENADFQSVNNFVRNLFAINEVAELNLRFFNPTQSWIADRVSKGLVEALMLRRATVTVYMAQKGDTFGKDSEASVALGQGKAVVVYVPRLYYAESGIDSEKLFKMDDHRLDERLHALTVHLDEEVDKKEKARLVLREELTRLTDDQFKRIIWQHWADFDLTAEAKEVNNEHLRASVVAVIKRIAEATSTDRLGDISVDAPVRAELVDRVIAACAKFESRADTFREIHPLALQVIVRSGVVNGIFVTRSVQDCGRLVRGIIENTLEYDVEVDETNYRLMERVTRSTIRVASRHRLLTFAFWTQYFEETALAIPHYELPAASL